MSLVVTCEAHDINPEEYLADVLLRIQEHPASNPGLRLVNTWIAGRLRKTSGPIRVNIGIEAMV